MPDVTQGDTSAARPPRWTGWLALALLALGVVRLADVVLDAPLAGYANQFDMVRTSACLGLWPDDPEQPRHGATRQAPLEAYRYGGERLDACYRSTTVALAALALGLDRLGEALSGGLDADFDLRQLGILHVALLLLIALLVDRRLRFSARARVGHALLFAAVLCDPFNTLYFNTLYTEGAALLSAYAAFAVLLSLARSAQPHWSLVMAMVLALLALGLSRMQHLALPLPLAALAALIVWRHGRRARVAALIWLLVATLVIPAQAWLQRDQLAIAAANRIDTLFGALLPASDDKPRLTARLGLPAHCASLAHVNWYMTRGRDPRAECPQGQMLSRLRMLWALTLEPRAAAVMFGRGLAQTTAWRLPYLGEVAGGSLLRHHQPSLAAALARAGFFTHALLWTAPLLFALWRACVALRNRRLPPRDALLLGAAALLVLGWLSSVLGDGYSEIGRHLHLAQNAALLAWLLLIGAAVEGWRHAAAAGVSILLAALFAASWLWLPMAEGKLTVHARAEGLHVSGWALDPAGIAQLHVRLGDIRIELERRPAADVAIYYPLPGEYRLARFEAHLPPGIAPSGRMQLLVTSSRGALSEADAVQLPAGLEPGG